MLQANARQLFARLSAACKRCGRDARDITIVAATKLQSAETVARLPEVGIACAGENRVQELLEKYGKAAVEWHLIGALQTNKVKYVVGKVALVHSVDRVSLAEELQRQSAVRGLVTQVLIEVNVGREPQKSGVLPEALPALTDFVCGLPNVRLRGLMTVLPKDAPDRLYLEMQRLYAWLRDRCDGIDILSMGMSDDYERAIAYGATLIRPGRALFGERGKKQGGAQEDEIR